MESYSSGDYVWAKTNKKYWPGIVLSAHSLGKSEKMDSEWVYWFCDERISHVRKTSMVRFHRLFERYSRSYFFGLSKKCYAGMIEALKNYKANNRSKPEDECETLKYNCISSRKSFYIGDTEVEHELLTWAFNGFPGKNHTEKNEIPGMVYYKLQIKQDGVSNLFQESPKYIKSLGKLENGVEKLCISCYHDVVYTFHPLFEGGICFMCQERYIERFFMIGMDNIHYCCAICSSFGNMIVCSNKRCGLSYCKQCLINLTLPGFYDYMMKLKYWNCFFCSSVRYSKTSRYLKRREDWRHRLHALFNIKKACPLPPIMPEKRKIRVLSLFDGISTGLLALKRLNVQVEAYFAAELDFNAKMVSLQNHDYEIEYLGSGDIRELTAVMLSKIMPIHLVLGGSPCNDLSMANPRRRGIYDRKGTGILFFEYCRIIALLKELGNKEFFWMYENVSSMPNDVKNIMTRFVECQPSTVNAACVSPQNRNRYFWGNLPSLHVDFTFNGGHSLQDYLDPGRTAAVDQIRTITTNSNSLKQGSSKQHAVYNENNEPDTLTINEIERIFGVPIDYTKYKKISRTARLILLGRAWSVQTICMLLHFLKYFYSVEKN